MNEAQTSAIAERALAEVLKNNPNSDVVAYTALFKDATTSAPIKDTERKSIVQKLEDRNILPEIMVGYLKYNFSKLDQNDDGQLSVAELESPKIYMQEPADRAKTISNESIKFDFDQDLLVDLLTRPGLYRDLAQASRTGSSSITIELAELEIYSKNRSKQTAFRQEIKPLLDGGSDSWMARLDDDFGEFDGYASAEDIAKFKKQFAIRYAPSPNTGVTNMLYGDLGSAVTLAKFPEELLSGKHPDILRDGALDVASLMRKAGLKPKAITSEIDYLDVEEYLKRTQLGYSGLERHLVKTQPDPDTK